MAKKNYPEEIYPGDMGILGAKSRCTPNISDIEYAYDLGKAHGKEPSDPLDWFSNLTQAIQDGVRIDWERLDGIVVKCVHERHGIVSTRLELQEDSSGLLVHADLSEPYAWREEGEPLAYLIDESWIGSFDWSLWVEGEIPVKKRTADELEPGTCFKGRYESSVSTYFTLIDNEGEKNAYHMTLGESFNPTDIEVLEVYGTGTLQANKKDED